MRDPSTNPLRCSIDPVSASILALGTAAGGAAGGLIPSLMGGGQQPPSPSAPQAPPPPIQQPQGTPSGGTTPTGNGTSTPSFIGSSSLPQQQGYGQKTLLGQ